MEAFISDDLLVLQSREEEGGCREIKRKINRERGTESDGASRLREKTVSICVERCQWRI
jgi:hypothetical protein